MWVSTQRWRAPETDPPIDDTDEPYSEATYADRPELVARILSGAFTRAAHWAISREKVPPPIDQDILDLRQRGILNGIYAHEYELTMKAMNDSRTVAATHLDVGAGPEEILPFLLKHRGQYEPPNYRDATTKDERKHSRLVRLLAELVAFGHTSPYKVGGFLGEPLESLKLSGYVANFGPFGYRLSERGVYGLCLDNELPSYPKRASDYDPPPRPKLSDEESRGL